VSVLGTIELVKTQVGAGRVDQQIEDGGLDRFLLWIAQPGQAFDKGVCDAEFHDIYSLLNSP
jgi:hypothetical protein